MANKSSQGDAKKTARLLLALCCMNGSWNKYEKIPFYIKASRVLAPLIILFGAINLLMGFGVAFGFIIEPEPGAYLGSSTSGQTIDKGIYRIIIGIVVGAISEIGYSLFNRSSD